MKINFILPARGNQFSGGLKVLYEYAQLMQQKGHQVTVIHMPFQPPNTKIKPFLSYIYGCFNCQHWQSSWFDLPDDIQQRWVYQVSNENMPDADISVLSFWHTALKINRLNKNKGKIIYLVQEYEIYMTASPQIQQQMAQGFRCCDGTVAISPITQQLVEDCGGKVDAYVPNGIDLNQFQCYRPLDDPKRDWIGFPWREESFKGCDLVIQVLENLLKLNPNLKIWAFGHHPKKNLPDWLHFHHRPSNDQLTMLYNQSAIFITPSQFEGWGLPGSEAMACGAALVSTDSGGVYGYARQQKNALISPYGDVSLLEKNITSLLNKHKKRLRLAKQGVNDIQQFTWQNAGEQFETVLKKRHQSVDH